VETKEAWLAWAKEDYRIGGHREPALKAMTPMQRRRAGFLSKMALEVAYQCLGNKTDVPTIFSSRHGDASRSVELLSDLANGLPLSPTSFGLSVHNAAAGLFSIARSDHASSIAIAAGKSSVEHSVIEACGLLSDGEPEVLLVVYDCPLPTIYASFQDCEEQPYAWAWLMHAASDDFYCLSWRGGDEDRERKESLPDGLEILRFHLRKDAVLERACDGRHWVWRHHAP
jgi:hypothetical protein